MAQPPYYRSEGLPARAGWRLGLVKISPHRLPGAFLSAAAGRSDLSILDRRFLRELPWRIARTLVKEMRLLNAIVFPFAVRLGRHDDQRMATTRPNLVVIENFQNTTREGLRITVPKTVIVWFSTRHRPNSPMSGAAAAMMATRGRCCSSVWSRGRTRT